MKVSFLLMFLLAVTSLNAEVKKGDKVASFNANDDKGLLWTSKESFNKDFLIVYFYPAAMTGGCTKQACAYRDNEKELAELGAQVVGVSGDSVVNLAAFKKMHNLNFPLLSDVNGLIAERFGVPSRAGGKINREIDGKKLDFFRSFSMSRWTFVIDKEGKVVYLDTKVNAAQDSETVIATLKKLKK
ncbi:MAG: redoxin domain-containing protein [Lentisphaeraceae bacterium]|nr:redoxin domain-containing protein [Lentisphaeraceae bacterium]